MFKIIAVTNRLLCTGDFLTQIEKTANNPNVSAVILREKDLQPYEYEKLAASVLTICSNAHQKCILHNFADVAQKLKCPHIHLPLNVLQNTNIHKFETVGSSVHSLNQLFFAQRQGATYVTAGHIFSTDCKKGVPPRGIKFLEEIKSNSSVPVYAIGGIDFNNLSKIQQVHADGACMMSYFMMLK